MRVNVDLYRAGLVFNDKREVSAKAYRVGLELVEEIETLRKALGQACMNLATIRPLDVMEPGEDLSLGERKERWVGRVLEQIALTPTTAKRSSPSSASSALSDGGSPDGSQ